jgi:hypothetical protein
VDPEVKACLPVKRNLITPITAIGPDIIAIGLDIIAIGRPVNGIGRTINRIGLAINRMGLDINVIGLLVNGIGLLIIGIGLTVILVGLPVRHIRLAVKRIRFTYKIGPFPKNGELDLGKSGMILLTKRDLLPLESLQHLLHILLYKAEDGGHAVGIGLAIEVKRPADKVAIGIGKEKLDVARGIATEVVENAANAMVVVNFHLVNVISLLGVLESHFVRVFHQALQIHRVVDVFISEIDDSIERREINIQPALVVLQLLPEVSRVVLHPCIHRLLKTEGTILRIIQFIFPFGENNAGIGLGFGGVVAMAGGEEKANSK